MHNMYHLVAIKKRLTVDSLIDTAKIFTTERSQAVRLPKAYRFDTEEVFIERKGDLVILRPKHDKDQWWNAVKKRSRL